MKTIIKSGLKKRKKTSFPFRKIHDLIELETLLIDTELQIKDYEKELDLLSTYYFETRYPGDYPEFTWDEAKKAFEAALKIKEFILGKIYQ